MKEKEKDKLVHSGVYGAIDLGTRRLTARLSGSIWQMCSQVPAKVSHLLLLCSKTVGVAVAAGPITRPLIV